MASRSLGTLTLDMVAKIGGFVDGFDKAERVSKKKTQEMKKTFSEFGKVAAAETLAVATGLAVLVKNQIDVADSTGDMAAKVGISVEEFSRLSYAFKFGTKDGADLSQTLTFLNKAIANDSEAFAALGVNVKNTDGTMRDASSVLDDVADKFAGMPDGAEKAALAMQLFGKSGADIIPFLNEGKAGIAEYKAEAERLGLVLSDDMANAAGHFNDNMTKAQSVVAGFGNHLMSAMLPALNGLGDEFIDTATDGDTLKSTAEGIAKILKSIVTVGVTVSATMHAIGNALGGITAAAAAALSGDLSGAKQILGDVYDDSVDIASNAMTRIDALWSASADNVVAAEAKKQAAIEKTARKAASAAGLRPKDGKPAPVGPSDMEINADLLRYGDAQEADFASQFSDDNTLDWLEEEARKQQELEDMRNEFRQRDLEQERAHADERARIGMSVLDNAGQLASGMLDIARRTGQEQTALGKALFLATKGVQIAQAVLSTNAAAAAALAPPPIGYGPIAGIGMSKLILGVGYASVGAMAATALTGQAHDGMTNIPSEGTWMLDGGERVLAPEQNRDLTNFLNKRKEDVGGAGGGPISIINQTQGRIDKVEERRLPDGERVLILQQARDMVAAEMRDPNSKTSRAMSASVNVQRRR